MVCPICIIAPLSAGGAYLSMFKNKYFWIGIIILLICLYIYYKNKDCETCKSK